MLAEWGDCRQAYAGPDTVAALAGVTPVTSQSGKHRAVHFRWACNKRGYDGSILAHHDGLIWPHPLAVVGGGMVVSA